MLVPRREKQRRVALPIHCMVGGTIPPQDQERQLVVTCRRGLVQRQPTCAGVTERSERGPAIKPFLHTQNHACSDLREKHAYRICPARVRPRVTATGPRGGVAASAASPPLLLALFVLLALSPPCLFLRLFLLLSRTLSAHGVFACISVHCVFIACHAPVWRRSWLTNSRELRLSFLFCADGNRAHRLKPNEELITNART